MAKVVATAFKIQKCPLYKKGAKLEFDGPVVCAGQGYEVCSIAVGTLLDPVRQIANGIEEAGSFENFFCGGCDKGKAWFDFSLSGDAKEDEVAEKTEKVLLGVLPKLKVFIGVPEDRLKRIIPLLKGAKTNPGNIVITQGEPGKALYIIVEGSFEVLSVDEHGSETKLATIGPGDVFGEMSLLTGDPASATVRASDAGKLLFMDRPGFEKMLSIVPSVSLTLARILAQRLAKTGNTVIEQLRQGMIGRLEHISPADLVQAMNVAGQTGVLIVQNKDQNMNMYFEEGHLREMELGDLKNEEAFYKFLTWMKGHFRFESGKKELQGPMIMMDTVGLLLEGMRRIDENKKQE